MHIPLFSSHWGTTSQYYTCLSALLISCIYFLRWVCGHAIWQHDSRVETVQRSSMYASVFQYTNTMAASLAYWFINVVILLPHIHRAQTPMIQKVTVMITTATVEFPLSHQASIRFDEEAHLYAVSRHRVIPLHILCIDPGCSFYYKQGFFYWRMITLSDVKRGEKRSTRIMTFRRGRNWWGRVERSMAMLALSLCAASQIESHPCSSII